MSDAVVKEYRVWMPVRCVDGKETIVHTEIGYSVEHAKNIVRSADREIPSWNAANPVVRYSPFIMQFVEVRD